MTSSFDAADAAPPAGRVVARGLAAAHGAPAGMVYLVLLHAPMQVASALAISLRARSSPGPGVESRHVLLALVFGGTLILFALAAFFLFPLIQGGVLGRVRDRLEFPRRRPRPLGARSQAHYPRMLGSQVLFTLILMAGAFPLVCLGAGLGIQEMPELTQPPPDGGAATPQVPPQGELERRLLGHPVFLAGLVLVTVLASAAGVVYWMAACVVVVEGVTVAAAWSESVRFCRRNLPAVLAVWLVNLAAGLVVSALGLIGQLGIVADPWVLSALAVLYSVLSGYWGVILAGVCMSLCLGRRAPAGLPEPATTAAVAG